MASTPASSYPPGPRGLPIWGNLLSHEKDPLGLFVESFRAHGDVVRFKLDAKPTYMLSHPDHVRYFLTENAPNYAKPELVDDPFLGNGLFVSEGNYWRRQRRLVQPAFHRERLAGLLTGMVDLIQRKLAQWEAVREPGRRFDIAEEMGVLSLRMTTRALYSDEPDEPTAEAMRRMMWMLNDRGSFLYRLLKLERLPIYKKKWADFFATLRLLNGKAKEVIVQRKQGGPEDDIMAMLLAAKDRDTGEGMTDKELRDEFMNLYSANEGAGAALAWAWHLLSTHPEIADRLAAESAAVLGGGAPTLESLPRLRYAMQVFEETLRLYPTAWKLVRVAKEADTVGGYRVEPGTVVVAITYVLHRHPEFWSSPETFDPDRFAPESRGARHKFAYIPFGAGQHICIGNNLSLMFGALVLAMVSQRFRLRAIPGRKVDIYPGISLLPRGGLPLTLEPRK
ncbi:cytochrome P450 [Myxococcus llanfairpwllgwyngyllgogerychwyrndrobwllllantysiliogogogochensis]|uniref:Cytochrome P450 n=1 Tax=Myxococcus llanfairpwllgwyngyllgogerychwyrndrobwllllantysiliogogogochensis TaxID=2590453 RepID=A0A540WYS3_9BACT|nr:cytochrome P450 [Myxococcus llanfairpwllgwyngyllgogerychwyrndrobwllllantysiliogogogochensis]TQF14159.1 cytochrome P450 [Myxococcus llanfairpwllgwyngyllgogerychwyrndrobwllllantysiliogogogochensis]